MSDIADDAAVIEELFLNAALSAKKTELKPIGRCHWCQTFLPPKQHFCDADCSYDYERKNVMKGLI